MGMGPGSPGPREKVSTRTEIADPIAAELVAEPRPVEHEHMMRTTNGPAPPSPHRFPPRPDVGRPAASGQTAVHLVGSHDGRAREDRPRSRVRRARSRLPSPTRAMHHTSIPLHRTVATALILSGSLLASPACTKSLQLDQSTTNKMSALCETDRDCDGEAAACVFRVCRTPCKSDQDCGTGGVCLADQSGRAGCRVASESSCTATPCASPLVCAPDATCRVGCKAASDCRVSGQQCKGSVCADASATSDASTVAPPPDGGSRESGAPLDAGIDSSAACGMRGSPCCSTPTPACQADNACAGQLCSCISDFAGNNTVRTASGNLASPGLQGTFVDSIGQRVVARKFEAYVTNGIYHGLLIKDDGTVMGFGTYAGVGPTTDTPTGRAPSPLPVIDDASAPAPKATDLIPSPQSSTIRGFIAGNMVYRWGQMGNSVAYRPVRIVANANGDPLSNVKQYWPRAQGGYAVLTDGTLVAHGWASAGSNTNGELGIGTSDTLAHPYPEVVQGLSGNSVAKVVSGSTTACALLSSGEVTCWGRNDSGSLGIGTLSGSATQAGMRVLVAAGVPLSGISDIAYGGYPCATRSTDGSLWCWGRAFGSGTGYAARVQNPSTGAPLLGVRRMSGSNDIVAFDDLGRLWTKPTSEAGPASLLPFTCP